MLVSTLNLVDFRIREISKPVCMLYLSWRLTSPNGAQVRGTTQSPHGPEACTLQEFVRFRNRHIQEAGTSQGLARFNFLLQLLSTLLQKFSVISTLRILHHFLLHVPISLRHNREVSSKLRSCWMLARLPGNNTPHRPCTCQSLLGSASHSCEAYLRLVRQPSAIL